MTPTSVRLNLLGATALAVLLAEGPVLAAVVGLVAFLTLIPTLRKRNRSEPFSSGGGQGGGRQREAGIQKGATGEACAPDPQRHNPLKPNSLCPPPSPCPLPPGGERVPGSGDVPSEGEEIPRPGFKLGFWIFSLLTVVIGAFFFVPEGSSVPSGEGALLGLSIVGRALAILLMARWVALGATAFEMARLGGRVGLRWLGFALGVAINALPDLEASARRTWDAMRMRGGFRRRRWYALRLFAVATLTNALMRADAQAESATARGLGLEAPAIPVPRWTVGQTGSVAAAWLGALLIAFLV